MAVFRVEKNKGYTVMSNHHSERVDDEQHRYFYPVHHTGTISDWGCPVLWLKCPVKQHDTLRPQAA